MCVGTAPGTCGFWTGLGGLGSTAGAAGAVKEQKPHRSSAGLCVAALAEQQRRPAPNPSRENASFLTEAALRVTRYVPLKAYVS